MKTTSRKFKLMMAFLAVLILPLGAFAVPDIYVCGAGTVTLAFTGAYTPVNGDKVIWQKVEADGTTPIGAAIVKPYSGVGTGDLVLTGTTDLTTAGDHYYRAHVVSADPATCTGDVSNAIDIYMLPTFTVDVTPATASYCVEGSTNTVKTIVSASASPASTLPAGVVFAYSWSSTPAAAGAVDAGDSKKFNMTATTVGSYTVTSSVTFDVSATGKTLKSASGTPCTQTGSTTITVAPKPGTPVISVS